MGGVDGALSYGCDVTPEHSAGRVPRKLAEERRHFRLAIGALVRGMRLADGGEDDEGNGMSQTELAERVGVSRWTISQMEMGKTAIGSDVLFSIFRALASKPIDMREVFELRFDENWHPIPQRTDAPELRKLNRRQTRLKGKPSTKK